MFHFSFKNSMPSSFFKTFIYYTLSSGVHVQNVQVCYIGIHVSWGFATSMTLSSTLGISPNSIPLRSPHCYPSPSFPPPGRPRCVMFPSCVHMFSLFSTHLWERTCGVWFSVLVSVCWEWWFPASSVPLQRTWTHPFSWLQSIPWCICATFSLSSLSLMGNCVGFKSLLLWTVLQ